MNMSEQEDYPEWMTEMDKEILRVLNSGLILSPSIIAININRSRRGVSNRLSSLQAGGFVEKEDRGKYRITEEGKEITKWAKAGIAESEAELIGRRREAIDTRRKIQQELGVSKEEYEEMIMEEDKKIQSEEPEIEDSLEEAIKRVESRLREEHSYFEEEKKRLREESAYFNDEDQEKEAK